MAGMGDPTCSKELTCPGMESNFLCIFCCGLELKGYSKNAQLQLLRRF